MPESTISVTEFLKEVWDDYNSPITSSFFSKIGICRSTIAQYEEVRKYCFKLIVAFVLSSWDTKLIYNFCSLVIEI